MSNTTTGLFETLMAAIDESSSALKYQNTMLDSVFTSLHPNYATIGSALNFNAPKVNESTVTNIGAGDIAPSDTDQDTVTVTFDTKWSTSYVIRNFDQARTPAGLREMFLDARLQSLMRKANRDIVGLVTSGNFNAYAPVVGGTAKFTRDHIKSSWANLAGAGVDVEDPANCFFITHTTPYSNMLDDSSFSQWDIVGETAATAAQRRAVILPQFGATLKYDQHYPVSTAGAYTALHFHRFAIAVRYAVEPLFQTSNGYIQERVVYPKPGVPVKLQMWDDGTKQGTVVNLTLCYGKAVIRPSHGSILVSA